MIAIFTAIGRTRSSLWLAALCCAAGLVSCGGKPDGSSSHVVDSFKQQPTERGVAPLGPVDTVQPRFVWPALQGATEYQLVVEDAAGNGYRQSVTSQDAGCSESQETCSAEPIIRYYNQSLKWRVNALVAGAPVALTEPAAFTTPADTEIQPVTDNAAVCDVWPTLVYDRFAVLNNIWNAGTLSSNAWQQTIAAEQTVDNRIVASWSYDWLKPAQGVKQAVKAYPEVIYGNKLGTLITADKSLTGLPERIEQLADFSIDFRYSETGNAERNVAIESFFHHSCEITGPCHLQDNRAYEMMVWVNNPKTWLPGDLALSGVEIDGQIWDVYIKPRSNRRYIAFTAQTAQTEGVLNWNRFVDWTVNWTTENAVDLKIEPMTADLCMGAIEFGTELWSGSGTFTLERFDISRQ